MFIVMVRFQIVFFMQIEDRVDFVFIRVRFLEYDIFVVFIRVDFVVICIEIVQIGNVTLDIDFLLVLCFIAIGRQFIDFIVVVYIVC